MNEQPAQSDIVCTDYRGRQVRVTAETVGHILFRHPELAPYLRYLSPALASPNIVVYRPRKESFLFYKRGVLGGSLVSAYLVVVVRYNGASEGVVMTAYPAGKPSARDRRIYESAPEGH